MAGIRTYNRMSHPLLYLIQDTGKDATCSFTEFIPFCSKLYYFSSYKNFKRFS